MRRCNGSAGASQSQKASKTPTGTPHNTKLARQPSDPNSQSMSGTVRPAPIVSPIINPSVKIAESRPIFAGNQRRISTEAVVCASAMPRLIRMVKRKIGTARGMTARSKAPAASNASPDVTATRAPMRSTSSPDDQAAAPMISVGSEVSSPVAVYESPRSCRMSGRIGGTARMTERRFTPMSSSSPPTTTLRQALIAPLVARSFGVEETGSFKDSVQLYRMVLLTVIHVRQRVSNLRRSPIIRIPTQSQTFEYPTNRTNCLPINRRGGFMLPMRRSCLSKFIIGESASCQGALLADKSAIGQDKSAPTTGWLSRYPAWLHKFLLRFV